MHWPCSHVYSDEQSESETHFDECLCSCHSSFVLVVSSSVCAASLSASG